MQQLRTVGSAGLVALWGWLGPACSDDEKGAGGGSIDSGEGADGGAGDGEGPGGGPGGGEGGEGGEGEGADGDGDGDGGGGGASEGGGGGAPEQPGGAVANPDFLVEGRPCEADVECRSGTCEGAVCVEPACDPRADRNACGGGAICAALVADDHCWPACGAPADCPEEFWCQPVSPNMSRCWPRGQGGAGAGCQRAADCAAGLCDRGECAARCDGHGGEAGEAAGCDEGRACARLLQGDVCRVAGGTGVGGACGQHADCLSGFCWDGTCRTPCGQGLPCGAGEVCRDVGATRVCVPSCVPADACPGGGACAAFVDGWGCRKAGALGPMEPCRQDTDCVSEVCSQGQCAPPCDAAGLGPAGCRDPDRACAAHPRGRVCLPSGVSAVREPVTRGYECQSGLASTGGRCTTSCTTTAECGPSFACILTPTTRRFGGRPMQLCERTCETSDQCPGWPEASFCDHRTDREGAPASVCTLRGWGGVGDVCLSNADCISGMCLGGACLLECGEGASCRSEAALGGRSDAVCTDGTGPEGQAMCLLPCGDAGSCPPRHGCVDGACRPAFDGSVGPSPGDPCFGPGSCTLGECIAGYCQGPCVAGECPAGQVCVPGRNVCRPACVQDADCAVRGTCARPEGEPPHCVR